MTGKSRKPLLCVDFDGVLHIYISGWTSASEVRDGPVAGAMDFLKRAVESFEVAVYSSRSSQSGGIEAMKKWLGGQLATRYGTRGQDILDQIVWPTEKPSAKVTLDDRAIQFDGIFPPIEHLMNFKPWNEHLKVKKSA